MRGRATGLALPALLVLALVAIVAIAATGSTPESGGETRPPSESLLDAIFSLGLVAVALGGVLLLYGLMQRQAIARELAFGRYPRTGLIAWLVFVGLFTAFTYWRMTEWEFSERGSEEGDAIFTPGEGAPAVPERSETAYEPSLSWIAIALVVGLMLAAAFAYVVAERRARHGRRSETVLAAELAVVLDETLDDLRAEADPRRAIIAAYARLERVLAANGVPRGVSETPAEYVPRVLHDLELDSGAVERLTVLFTRAKFSQHEVHTAMKEEAIGALGQVRDELRASGTGRALAPPPAAPVGGPA
jgi:hypothetical protein